MLWFSCIGNGESLKGKSDALICVKIRALCNRNYFRVVWLPSVSITLACPPKPSLLWLHLRAIQSIASREEGSWFWTWALVGLIPLSEINKYLLRSILAQDTRLFLFLAQRPRALNALLSSAIPGFFRKKKGWFKRFSSTLFTPVSWPTQQAPRVRDAQTLFFWLLSLSWGFPTLASVIHLTIVCVT